MERNNDRRPRISSADDKIDNRSKGFESTSLKIPQGVKLFKVESEETKTLRIIPYVVGEGNPNCKAGLLHYERTFYTHKGVGANGDTYICARKTFNKKCPICEHRQKLINDESSDEQTIKDLYPKERQLFWVLDMGNREAGLQLWDVSFHLFGKLLDERIQKRNRQHPERSRWNTFHDPDNGFDLEVEFREKAFQGHKYYETSAIEFTPRTKPILQKWLDKATSLDDILRYTPADKLGPLFHEEEPAEEGDEEAAPVKKKKKKKKSSGSSRSDNNDE